MSEPTAWSMQHKTVAASLVVGGAAAVLLYYYLRNRNAQASVPPVTTDGQAYSLATRAPVKTETGSQRKEDKKKDKKEKTQVSQSADGSKEYTCACGLKVAEGGCTPGYNPALLGTVKQYSKHVVICTGTKAEEWDAKITQPGAFATTIKEALERYKGDFKSQGRKVVVTNSDEVTLEDNASADDRGRQRVADLIVFPEKIRYLSVDADHVEYIITDHLLNDRVSERVKHVPFEQDLILVCCHANRDSRCGSRGPEAHAAFQKALAARDIGEDKVMVRQSSHLGGHKYAGVVVVYPRGDWYGFIDGDKAEQIVDKYIVKGKVVHQQWRGRMGLDKSDTKARAAQKCEEHRQK